MTHIDNIADAKTTDDLADLFDAYCIEQGWDSPEDGVRLDAEELLWLEAAQDHQKQWLQAFIDRWKIVQNDEDFAAICAMRGE